MSSLPADFSKTIWIIAIFTCFLNSCAAVTIDCSHPPPLVDPQTCCSDGGPDEVSDRCAKKFGITGSLSQAQPNIETATCLAECVLAESKYLVGQTLNIAAIRMDLQKKFPSDPSYVETMARAYQKCSPIAARKLEELKKIPQGAIALKGKCSPLSGIILGCTYTDYFQNCPSNHWNPSEQCQIAKQFLQKCAVF